MELYIILTPLGHQANGIPRRGAALAPDLLRLNAHKGPGTVQLE